MKKQIITICDSDSINETLNCLDLKKGSVLKLLPGIYTEDVKWPSNLTVEGSGVADLDFTVLKGQQFFPYEGKIGFNHLKFECDNRIFLEKAKTNVSFLFRSCVFQTDNGYAFDIPSMSGVGIFFDCWVNGRCQAFINNEFGDIKFKFFNMTSESKTNILPMKVCDESLFFNVHITHDICFHGSSKKILIEGGSWMEGKLIKSP